MEKERMKAGDKIGRLELLSVAEYTKDKRGTKIVLWNCLCDCGNEVIKREDYMRYGIVKSCGCLRSEASAQRARERLTTHGCAGTKLYFVWRNMIDRCENEDNKSFHHYGGKGVKVCDEWHDPRVFVEWAEQNGYGEGLTIDRIDASGDYCPENCRLATSVEQNNHTSRNHYITFNGTTMTMAQWSRETGISYAAIKSRLNKHGWSVERALTTPVQ